MLSCEALAVTDSLGSEKEDVWLSAAASRDSLGPLGAVLCSGRFPESQMGFEPSAGAASLRCYEYSATVLYSSTLYSTASSRASVLAGARRRDADSLRAAP
jgi:hypothetical protein